MTRADAASLRASVVALRAGCFRLTASGAEALALDRLDRALAQAEAACAELDGTGPPGGDVVAIEQLALRPNLSLVES